MVDGPARASNSQRIPTPSTEMDGSRCPTPPPSMDDSQSPILLPEKENSEATPLTPSLETMRHVKACRNHFMRFLFGIAVRVGSSQVHWGYIAKLHPRQAFMVVYIDKERFDGDRKTLSASKVAYPVIGTIQEGVPSFTCDNRTFLECFNDKGMFLDEDVSVFFDADRVVAVEKYAKYKATREDKKKRRNELHTANTDATMPTAAPAGTASSTSSPMRSSSSSTDFSSTSTDTVNITTTVTAEAEAEASGELNTSFTGVTLHDWCTAGDVAATSASPNQKIKAQACQSGDNNDLGPPTTNGLDSLNSSPSTTLDLATIDMSPAHQNTNSPKHSRLSEADPGPKAQNEELNMPSGADMEQKDDGPEWEEVSTKKAKKVLRQAALASKKAKPLSTKTILAPKKAMQSSGQMPTSSTKAFLPSANGLSRLEHVLGTTERRGKKSMEYPHLPHHGKAASGLRTGSMRIKMPNKGNEKQEVKGAADKPALPKHEKDKKPLTHIATQQANEPLGREKQQKTDAACHELEETQAKANVARGELRKTQEMAEIARGELQEIQVKANAARQELQEIEKQEKDAIARKEEAERAQSAIARKAEAERIIVEQSRVEQEACRSARKAGIQFGSFPSGASE